MPLDRQTRQDDLIRHIADGETIQRALALAGVHRRTAQDWRHTDGNFKRKWDTAKKHGRVARTITDGDPLIYDPAKPRKPVPPYAEWLTSYTGFPVAAHLEPVAEAYEDRTNLVVLVLGPPGSGKDTTAGFLVLHASCEGYQRVAWIMEAEKFSIRRLNERLSPYLTDPKVYDHTPSAPGAVKPKRNLIEDYGPFRWEKGMKYPDGTPVERPRWSAEEKYFVNSRTPEADPNLWATGISGALYGSRVDLMVLSDPFTTENQRSPTGRADQLAWLEGTVESRLDEGGRLIILGTRVAPYDNYGVLLERYTRGAHIIYENGFYQKWSNGTATVIYPAIQTSEDGEERSYWPERFPLDDHLTVRGEVIQVEGMSDEDLMEHAARGAVRTRGLRGIRQQKPDTFQTLYQQAPPASSSGDFTEAILNHCDDVTRTLGVVKPGEVLVLGIDPARSGGAGWVLWGWNRKENTVTVIDLFYGEKLGMVGLRERLLVDPTLRYLPRYLCYEMNYEASVLDHPEVKEAMSSTATELVRHRTDRNRSDSEVGLPGMVFKMRDGTIRFPASTVEDRRRIKQLKDHFLAWDMKTSTDRTRSGQFKHIPDDLAMAAWIGFTKIREMMDREGKMVPQRQVSAAVQQAWGTRRLPDSKKGSGYRPVTDVIGFWTGDDGGGE